MRATAWVKHAATRSEHNPHHASLSFSSTESGYSFAKTASRTRSAMLERQELASTFFTTPQSFETSVSPTAGLAWLRLTGDEADTGSSGLESAGLGLLGGRFGGGRKLMRTSATFVVREGEVVKCPRPCVSCVWLSSRACHICVKSTCREPGSETRSIKLREKTNVPGGSSSSQVQAVTPAQPTSRVTRPNAAKLHSPRTVTQSQHRPYRSDSQIGRAHV